MALINLTEEYFKTRNPSLAEMVMNLSKKRLDIYLATSLNDIRIGFKMNPPKKIDSWSELPSAYVMIESLQLRRHYPDFFDENDKKHLKQLHRGNSFPVFEIKDFSDERMAYWMAGSADDFFNDKQNFNLTPYSFQEIPLTYLKYMHKDNTGWMVIKSLHSTFSEEKSLDSKISQMYRKILPENILHKKTPDQHN